MKTNILTVTYAYQVCKRRINSTLNLMHKIVFELCYVSKNYALLTFTFGAKSRSDVFTLSSSKLFQSRMSMHLLGIKMEEYYIIALNYDKGLQQCDANIVHNFSLASII